MSCIGCKHRLKNGRTFGYDDAPGFDGICAYFESDDTPIIENGAIGIAGEDIEGGSVIWFGEDGKLYKVSTLRKIQGDSE